MLLSKVPDGSTEYCPTWTALVGLVLLTLEIYGHVVWALCYFFFKAVTHTYYMFPEGFLFLYLFEHLFFFSHSRSTVCETMSVWMFCLVFPYFLQGKLICCIIPVICTSSRNGVRLNNVENAWLYSYFICFSVRKHRWNNPPWRGFSCVLYFCVMCTKTKQNTEYVSHISDKYLSCVKHSP